MTDPWADFILSAGDSEVSGYFEEVIDRESRSARTISFRDPPERLTVSSKDTAAGLEARLDRWLRRGPRAAVVGYLGFDAVGLFEPLLRRFPAGSPFPLGEFVSLPELHFRRAKLAPRLVRAPGMPPIRLHPAEDTLPRRAFEAEVRSLIESIRQGDAYQVVLSHRRGFRRPTNLLSPATRLRQSERYAFFYYLRFGDREILGASPESVVESRGDRAFINPIAGTRPIGQTRGRRLPLTRDRKELAEHRMLVDLARNDLGKVARPGSVRLLSIERVERYARLEHLVSRVGAHLRPGLPALALLGASFPAGTVSGAPKIRATQLLRRAERTWRGPYGGAIGFQSAREGRWALAIRTAFAASNRLYTAAGAGIVARSRPAREFDETLVKLAQVESALAGGEDP
ncbi:MAG: anthranilate synthase component I family protein [Thermoplasmata archaeon]